MNKNLVPRLWGLNGFDIKYMPKAKPGPVGKIDIDELGKYISDLARAGAPLFPDEKLEGELRHAANLPPKNIEDTVAAEDGVIGEVGNL